MCATRSTLTLRRTGDTTFMNDDVGQQILRELQDTKSDVKTFAFSLNALNTEVARMSVKVEQLSNLQQTAIEHDRRIAALEASTANQDKFTQRIGEQTRWIIALAISSVISLLAIGLQMLKMAGTH